MILTFKNHLIAGSATCDPKFPIRAWDHLIDQAELSLNLLRGSNMNPAISAWHQLRGPFSFDATPIEPPATPVEIFESPEVRSTFAPHSTPGFYVGPALSRYRCYKVWKSSTSAIRVSDTITWHPSKFTMPTPSPALHLQLCISELASAPTQFATTPDIIRHSPKPSLPLLPTLTPLSINLRRYSTHQPRTYFPLKNTRTNRGCLQPPKLASTPQTRGCHLSLYLLQQSKRQHQSRTSPTEALAINPQPDRRPTNPTTLPMPAKVLPTAQTRKSQRVIPIHSSLTLRTAKLLTVMKALLGYKQA
jgi:hypothetical protein